MPAKKRPYLNQFTGNVVVTTRQGAKKLSEDYQEIQFTKNEDGVPVMRMQFNGATVDVSENDEAIEGEVVDGKPESK